MTSIERPISLQVNAWDGQQTIVGDLVAKTPFGQRAQGYKPATWLAPLAEVDMREWKHPDVGWGLVLPDNDDLTDKDRAGATDAPEAIQRLLASRPGSPVLRWRKELQQGYLRRYYPDGKSPQDLSTLSLKPGIKEGHVPRYLLIYASPQQIPWAVQYALNLSTFVGRLDLTGDGLEHYINALISDWATQPCDPTAPLIWQVNQGAQDITALMCRVVAGKVWEGIAGDPDLGNRLQLKDESATGADLYAALAERQPALVVTTSHGMTGPLNDQTVLATQLGLPVDRAGSPISLEGLMPWKANGAIWYAHACCSAGADGQSRYRELFPADNSIGLMLNAVAASAGSTIAPLPRALLGAPEPLRAFVGHVEPTFDWTLKDPLTGQPQTYAVCDALYPALYRQSPRTPIGYALHGVYEEAGHFYGAWQQAVEDINKNVAGMRDWALYRQLVAMDRQTLVIIGDPTVALPLLKGS
jgi:hypothetical protein